MSRDLYTEVTNRILEQLASGAAPWIEPWSATPGNNHPCNAATGRPYSGANVVLLWITAQNNGWTLPRYLTFKQALELGGNVRKGEHGTKVYFVKQLIVKDSKAESDDATRMVSMLREYNVFNVAQCENLPERISNPSATTPRNKEEREQIADSFMNATGADIREGNGEAYFRPGADYISLPHFSAFKNADSFYATAFHELGHWTGAKSRLDRSAGMKSRFGDNAYAAEELVAELCAAFLCAEFAMDGDIRHAGYIDHWSKLLRGDSRAFFTAASKAQAAASYLRDLANKESPATETETELALAS